MTLRNSHFYTFFYFLQSLILFYTVILNTLCYNFTHSLIFVSFSLSIYYLYFSSLNLIESFSKSKTCLLTRNFLDDNISIVSLFFRFIFLFTEFISLLVNLNKFQTISSSNYQPHLPLCYINF